MGRPPTWTDEQLLDAVAASRSMKEVVQRLRAVAGAASHRAVAVRIEVLELSTEHFAPSTGEGSFRAPPHERTIRRRWSDEELAEAVAASTSLKGVFDALGLVPGGSQWQLVRALILELNLDTSHWRRPLQPDRVVVSWSDAELRDAVAASRSYADALRRLGSPPSGSANRRVREDVRRLGLDTSHFVGQRWAKGQKNPAKRTRKPLSELLIAGRDVKTASLRRRLIDEGVLEPSCSRCGRDTWEDRPIPLELDHINGDRRDNRLENLRLLCPNCHALTDTYRGRNIGRYTET
jgi:5-methylcytosine-specific restriction endonuclease McrA